jgi:hypothetical protein
MTIDNYKVLSESKSRNINQVIIDANSTEDIQFTCKNYGNAPNIKFCSDGNKEDRACFKETTGKRQCSRNISLSDLGSCG